MYKISAKDLQPEHFRFEVQGKVATLTLNRPERKNPLTFESYAEMRDLFRKLAYVPEIKTVVLTGAGGNFCSGGDVHEIIGPLTKMDMGGLLEFTRMTGDVVRAMRNMPQPIVCAIDGICAGAGTMLACGSDIRYGTPKSKVAFLFVKVGLAGADMGACTLLSSIVGHGRASELLFTGRAMPGEEAERWGFYNALVEPEALAERAKQMAQSLADGPAFAHAMTKKMLLQEWNMGGRGAGAGDLHADAGFPPRLSCVRRQADPEVRRQLNTTESQATESWPGCSRPATSMTRCSP